jgi:hypothetical protein
MAEMTTKLHALKALKSTDAFVLMVVTIALMCSSLARTTSGWAPSMWETLEKTMSARTNPEKKHVPSFSVQFTYQ